mmetsp:Transcript_11827/g.35233  ORF Transcript_11827/g.35233 Transcript_11827/m.35233 type:complete len:427 (+) Transcript_11827:167-1447(+)
MRILVLLAASAAALEYCNQDGECETIRKTSNGSVHLDDGCLGGETISLESLANTGLKELRYMKRHTSPRKAPGASMGAKFRNFRRKVLEMRWDDGSREGVYSGTIDAMGRTSTLSYSGHAFLFLDPDTREVIIKFTMEAGNNLYLVPPHPDDQAALDSADWQEAQEEVAFMRKYEEENGVPWLAYYGREKPHLNMWPADFVGQTHVVSSDAGYHDGPGSLQPGPLALSLQVISHNPQGPRVFLVRELLSDYECDHIVELGAKVIRKSMVGQGGGFTSKTRTSQNGWLRRSASPVLEQVYKRFGDVLGIDHNLLTHGVNAEELQVVRYERSQEYAPHHDFGDDGTPEQRFLTLLLYIQLPDAGGATSFPKAADGRGVQVVPARGDAVLFYNMRNDGNADDLALHAGMPIHAGQKWVCNLWVWDPRRR